ncbi:hypothetical protein [Nocardia sp. NPDC047038]|uniref:hypothetical protein n=1 Tax=Nocardia sp. NPDC047038 TaxID=3154338 RepID=UPI003410BB7D
MSSEVAIDLSEGEREVLSRGLNEWGGPARCTEKLAVAMGFQSVADLFEQKRRLYSALASNEPLSAQDWRRTLVATEIVFASDTFGSGIDWETTTGLSDEETIRVLRRLQRKILRALHP